MTEIEKIKKHPMYIEMQGEKHGKLLVLQNVRKRHGKIERLCLCECGGKIFARSDLLKNGKTSHCGCLNFGGMGVNESAFNAIYNSIKCSARRRNIIFSLNKKELRTIITQNCYYCGEPPSQVKKPFKARGQFVYNGIDRLDNNGYYDLYNSVPCCGMCNRMKLNHSVSDFLIKIKSIYDNCGGII